MNKESSWACPEERQNSGDSFNISGIFKEPENIPLMIFHPELEKNSISKTGTHTDIAPTIFDLLGYSKKPEGFLGNSLLTKKENPILFLHETTQVLYKNNLFLRMPQSSEIDNKFKRIAVKKKTNKVDLPESKKRRMIHLIDYVQMLMRKNRSENTH